MVRIQDGNIVAIGGLMKVESTSKISGLPGTSDMPILSYLFGNQVKVGRKKELVVLIKPTIIRTADDWEKQTQLAREALNDMETSRVVSVNGTAEDIKPTSGEK
jgi:MSHA biogenesis protein MshL